MSIIQEALKRAQDDHENRKKSGFALKIGPPGKYAIVKKIIFVIFIIALCAMATGFGIRMLFSKILAMEKEKKLKNLVLNDRETDFDMTGLMSPFVKTPQPVTQNFVLNGIMYLGERPRAIINGSVVVEGDVINGATVTSISENSVSLKYINNNNKIEMVLDLKE